MLIFCNKYNQSETVLKRILGEIEENEKASSRQE